MAMSKMERDKARFRAIKISIKKVGIGSIKRATTSTMAMAKNMSVLFFSRISNFLTT